MTTLWKGAFSISLELAGFCELPLPWDNADMRKFSNFVLQTSLAVLVTISGAAGQNGGTAAAPASGAEQKPQTTVNIPELPTEKDKVSYAIGMNVGKGLHRDAIEVDPQVILKGLQDGLSGGKTLMTDEQLQSIMVKLQAEVRDRENAKRKEEGVTNQKEGEAFLAANKTKPGVITLPDGLQYKIIKQGTGPKPTLNDVVECNYKGTLLNGKEFDSSYKRGAPETFPVKGVIRGWTEVLQLIPVGTKFELYLPPDLAYGELGAGRDIGPNETLTFEVELLAIKDVSHTQPNPPVPDQKK